MTDVYAYTVVKYLLSLIRIKPVFHNLRQQLLKNLQVTLDLNQSTFHFI